MKLRNFSKNPALKPAPKTSKTPLVTFTVEQVEAWPEGLRSRLGDVLRLDDMWVKMQRRREKWRLRYHKRKLATAEKTAA